MKLKDSPKILFITFNSYLHNRLQKTNVNNNFSQWKNYFAGVPQGSILCPLVCNININNTFLFANNVCLSNYADDITLYSVEKNHNTNRNIRKNTFYLYNFIVLNSGKCCYMSFGSNPEKSDLILEDSTKISSTDVVIGVIKDNWLTCYNHLKRL